MNHEILPGHVVGIENFDHSRSRSLRVLYALKMSLMAQLGRGAMSSIQASLNTISGFIYRLWSFWFVATSLDCTELQLPSTRYHESVAAAGGDSDNDNENDNDDARRSRL